MTQPSLSLLSTSCLTKLITLIIFTGLAPYLPGLFSFYPTYQAKPKPGHLDPSQLKPSPPAPAEPSLARPIQLKPSPPELPRTELSHQT